MTDWGAPHARHYTLATGALGALALATIWLPPLTPGVDTPSHLYFAQIWATPERFAGLAGRTAPLTSQLWVFACALFLPCGAALAAKAASTVSAAVLVTGALALGRAQGQRCPVGVLVALTATQSFFTAMGFLNFTFAIGLGVWTLAALERALSLPSTRRWAVVAAAALLTAVGHVIVAVLFGVHALIRAGLGPAVGRRSGLARTLVAFLPAAAYAAAAVAVHRVAGFEAPTEVQETVARLPFTAELHHIVTDGFGGFTPLAALGLGAASVAAIAGSLRNRLGPVVLGGGVVWLATYFLWPYHGWGWAWAQPRVLAMLCFVTPLHAGWGPRPTVTLILVAALGGGYLASSIPGVVSAGRDLAEAEASFAAIPPGRSMEVVVDPGVGLVDAPLQHAGELALMAGGVSPSIPPFSPMVHAARSLISHWPPHPPPYMYRGLNQDGRSRLDAHRRQLDRVAVQGLRYDTVTLVGGAAWTAPLEQRGYAQVAPAILRAQPSAIVVWLHTGATGATNPIDVRAAYPGTIGPFAGVRRPPRPAASSPERIVIAPVPAGPTRVEAVVAGDDAGTVLARVDLVVPAGAPVEVTLGSAPD